MAEQIHSAPFHGDRERTGCSDGSGYAQGAGMTMNNEWIIEALEKDDFVYIENNVFLRLKSVGGLTLVAELKARWIRDDLIEEREKEK
jgi:hypothetical protein